MGRNDVSPEQAAAKAEAMREYIRKRVEEAKEQVNSDFENSLHDLKDSIKEAKQMIDESGHETYPVAIVELAQVLLGLKMRKRQQLAQLNQQLNQAMKQGCKGCTGEGCEHKSH